VLSPMMPIRGHREAAIEQLRVCADSHGDHSRIRDHRDPGQLGIPAPQSRTCPVVAAPLRRVGVDPPALRPLHLDPVGMARHRVDVRRLRHGRRTRVGPRARRPRREDRRGHTPVAPDLRAVPQAPVPSPRGMGRPVVGEGEPCRPSRIQPSSGRRPACSCRRSRSCWEHSRGSASAGPPPVTASGGRSSGQPRFGSRSIPIDRSARAERTSQCSRYRRGNRRQRPVAFRLPPPPLSLREQRLSPYIQVQSEKFPRFRGVLVIGVL
jgi:hypothetical protein